MGELEVVPSLLLDTLIGHMTEVYLLDDELTVLRTKGIPELHEQVQGVIDAVVDQEGSGDSILWIV